MLRKLTGDVGATTGATGVDKVRVVEAEPLVLVAVSRKLYSVLAVKPVSVALVALVAGAVQTDQEASDDFLYCNV